MGMLEENFREERESELEMDEDISILEEREKHWKYFVEDNTDDKGKVRMLSWELYMKQKQNFIKRGILVEVTHPKGVNIFLEQCGV